MDWLHPFARQVLPEGRRKLYKFRSFDSTNPDRLARIFTHCELYFPSPSELNDPFECKLFVRPPDLSTEVEKWRAVRKMYRWLLRNGTPRETAKQRAECGQDKVFMQKLADELTEQLPLAFDEYRICSFSSAWEPILLWSHYADSHKGICIVFDADDEDNFGTALKVNYSDDYPTVDYFDRDPNTLLSLTALTKAKAWEYEQEFRLITKHPPLDVQLPVDNHLWFFPRKLLIEVILGSRIDVANEKAIRNLVSVYEKPIKISRALPIYNKYSLRLVDA